MPVRKVTSEEEFDAAIKDIDVVVVDFFATWCGPCRAISPYVESISETLIPAATAAKESKKPDTATEDEQKGEEGEATEKEVGGEKNEALAFLKVDVDELPLLAQNLSVMAMPTFLIFKKGELAKTVVGARPEEIDAKLDEVLEEVFGMPKRTKA